MRRLVTTLLISSLASSLMLSGCGDEDITVVITGPFEIEECPGLSDQLSWEFASFYRGPDNSGILRLQATHGPPNEDDHLVFSIGDVDELRSRQRERIPLRTGSGLISGSMNLSASCSALEGAALATDGDIIFSNFTGELDSIVQGEASFRLVDARDPSISRSAELQARFSFTIRRYRPYQTFNSR